MAFQSEIPARFAVGFVERGDADRLELTDPAERGAGRLILIVRRHKSRISSEWYVQWYRSGTKISTKLGAYPEKSLAVARREFRDVYAPQILKGIDPTGPRAWTRNSDGSLQALFEGYVASLKAQGKVGASRAWYMLLYPTSGAAFHLGGSRLAKDIKPEDITPLLGKIHARGKVVQANNMRAWIRDAFEWGLKAPNNYTLGEAGMNFQLTHNPAARIPTDKAAWRTRDRALSHDEFKAFWMWLEGRKGSLRYKSARALQIVMATGQRPSEILRLTRQSFNREEGTVEWPVTKNGRPHCIPLPRRALDILNEITPNEHGIFFSATFTPDSNSRTHVCETLVNKYVREEDVPHFTARDLRRTWKTLAGEAGLSKEIRDRLQNHSLQDISAKHYDRWTYLPEKRAAMEVWGAFMDEILSGELQGGTAETRSCPSLVDASES